MTNITNKCLQLTLRIKVSFARYNKEKTISQAINLLTPSFSHKIIKEKSLGSSPSYRSGKMCKQISFFHQSNGQKEERKKRNEKKANYETVDL
jgi:hypothetical protein